MLIEERLKELKDKINEKVPSGITVSDVEFEGPELVIYTDDPKKFADEADLILQPQLLDATDDGRKELVLVAAEDHGDPE